MTITEYYITFGFEIKLASLMQKEGYTVESLTEELRDRYRHECDDPQNDEQIVMQWFKEDFLSHGYAGHYKFTINGLKFIIRTFTHDEKEHDKYVVVGVNMGTVNNFDGTMSTTGINGTENLKTLVKDAEWAKLILECPDCNACAYRLVDYGIPDPRYEKFSIAPSTFFTTNDCGCCS